jgi:hypothetical protein
MIPEEQYFLVESENNAEVVDCWSCSSRTMLPLFYIFSATVSCYFALLYLFRRHEIKGWVET